jgi:hypothetical protein
MAIRRVVLGGLFLSGAALLAVACGGSNPSGPSGTAGVRVEGTVLGGTAGAGITALSTGTAASGPITVSVEGTSISVTVSGNGTFVLEGLPEGTFTLVFTQGRVVLGKVKVTDVSAGAHVQIVVQVTGGTIILVQLKIQGQEQPRGGGSSSCLIAGGTQGQPIELEGSVAPSPTLPTPTADAFSMQVNGQRSSGLVDVTAGAAAYTCVGNAKSSDCKSQLRAGAKVHVSGTLTTCTQQAATVVATQVKIQK